jgi:hypothetical protein
MTVSIIDLTRENLSEHLAGPACFLNPAHPAAKTKADWLTERFKEGMKVKVLRIEGEKKPVSLIEYTKGENAWRAVDAHNYLFIHCVWTYPNKYKGKDYSSNLIQACIKEAKEEKLNGVAAITSEGSFMASREVFEKNDFKSVEYRKPHDLMVLELKKGDLPKFKDTESALKKYDGLHIVYSKQCPWVIRFMEEAKELIEKSGAKVTELKTAKEAQESPSIYATFNTIYNGKLLADHYISTTRFKNIIAKELK